MKNTHLFSYQTADESSGFLLWRTHNYWQREIRQRLKPFGLTHTQFVVLASTHWLNLQHQSVTQIDIAQHAKTDTMLTSNVVRALEKKALLKRHEHHRDTRAKTVQLSGKGVKLLEQTIAVVEAFDREFFSQLEDSQQFNAELSRLMQQ